ncbi:MAG: Gfo/Idh/MocA family oxidoreductase [Planctomycetes bacterium]|nr:Gfo/Idh/MocA family oxidoreductase [Planctomycetota bacterium]
MIKVAIIGCGFIADQHAAQLQAIPSCKIVAACDTEELMAAQLADRFHIEQVFTNTEDMLQKARPDAVHINTPAQTHFKLGRMCLEAGCHVYMEKPFTETVAEAEALIQLAKEKQCRITVGHNLQFSPEAVRMRELVKAGFLGGPPIHMESIQCYSHDEPTYGKVVLADPNHWVRRLPGSLLQNLISHGISKIAEFLVGDNPSLICLSFSSPFLRELGQSDIVDEVRATIQDEQGTTAFFLFTTQFGAGSNELRLYGKSGNLVVDNTYRTILRYRPSHYKSYLRYFFAPWTQARELVRNSNRNMRLFARNDFHMDYGMKRLMDHFYSSIRDNGPDPIPVVEILRTARIMEAIFKTMPTYRVQPPPELMFQKP